MPLGSHTMEFPRRIRIGEGILGELGDFIEFPAGRRSAVIASGANVQEKVKGVVTDSIGSPVEWVEVDSSDMKNVERVMKTSSEAYCIIGIGGGKSVDVGKLAAHRINLPFFSVPTSASHDGISSPFASISGMGTHYSERAKPPVGILADIEVIAAAPRRLEVPRPLPLGTCAAVVRRRPPPNWRSRSARGEEAKRPISRSAPT